MDTMLCNAEKSGSANEIISNLEKNSPYEVCALSIEKRLRCVADLGICFGRDAIEARDALIIRIPSALSVFFCGETLIVETKVNIRFPS